MESEDLAGWQEHNLRFHELIYGATRNPYLRQEVLHIRARTGFYRRHAFGALGRVRASFDQHAEIVRAFEQADPQAAVQAMSGHMRPDRGGGSITDFVGVLKRDVTVDEINAAFKAAATSGPLSKVLVFTDEEIVSSDIVGQPASCTFDSKLTMAMGNLVKVLGWYDNEWGYSNRLVDLVQVMAKAAK
jgi:hypothetical protein